MPATDPLPLALVPHPAGGGGAVHRLDADLHRAGDHLELRFRLEGPLDRLTIPAPRAPERRDGLWRHTCFEAFLARPGEPGYAELNLSPAGEWAAYRFDAYRAGMRDLVVPEGPTTEVRRGPRTLELTARVAALPAPWGRAEVLRVGLSAVVEDARGRLSYWALAHVAGAPDFHHHAARVLEVGRRR